MGIRSVAAVARSMIRFRRSTRLARSTMRFHPTIRTGPQLDPLPDDLQECPWFVACEPEFVLTHSDSPEFLKRAIELTPWATNLRFRLVEVRSFRLEVGKPSKTPFWHLDNAVRPTIRHPNGLRADLSDPLMVHSVAFGKVALTEFIASDLDVAIEQHELFDYRKFNRAVELVGAHTIWRPCHGQIVSYDHRTIHRSGAVEQSGLRVFVGCVESDSIAPLNELAPPR